MSDVAMPVIGELKAAKDDLDIEPCVVALSRQRGVSTTMYNRATGG